MDAVVKIHDLKPNIEKFSQVLSKLITEVLPQAVEQEVVRLRTVLTMLQGWEHQKTLPAGTYDQVKTKILAAMPLDSPVRLLLEGRGTLSPEHRKALIRQEKCP